MDKHFSGTMYHSCIRYLLSALPLLIFWLLPSSSFFRLSENVPFLLFEHLNYLHCNVRFLLLNIYDAFFHFCCFIHWLTSSVFSQDQKLLSHLWPQPLPDCKSAKHDLHPFWNSFNILLEVCSDDVIFFFGLNKHIAIFYSLSKSMHPRLLDLREI